MTKKSFFIMAMAMGVFAMTSCNKENPDVTGPDMAISLEQMESIENDGSKTLFDPSTKKFYWKSSDKLMVYDADMRNIVYKDNDATGSYDYENGTFSGSTSFINLQPSYADEDWTGCTGINSNSSNFYAFYPSYYVSRVGGDFVYTIPAKQLLDNNQNIDKINQLHLTRYPMARKTTTHQFQMKNMCGAIKLRLQKTGVSVKSIQFRALGDQQVCGSFVVNFITENGESGVPQMVQTDANSTTRVVTLELNQPVPIDEQRDFYIALPPAIYNGFEVVVTSADNQTATITVSSNVEIKRNQIRALTVSEANFTGTRAFKDSHGKFSISDNQRVYIAPGNLQWNNGNWQFAPEQYDVLTIGCDATYSPDAFNWDLFHFSLEGDYVVYPGNEWSMFLYQEPLSRRSSGITSNYGMSTDSKDYTYSDNWPRTQQHLTNTVYAPKYRNWGLAFGANSNWMVLSVAEYEYLVTGRINSHRATCTVNGVSNASYCRITVVDDYGVLHPGFLLFPDSWENGYTDESIDSEINWEGRSWNVNGSADWADTCLRMRMHDYRIFEEAGCAFFPATGWVEGSWSTGGTLNGAACMSGSVFNARGAYWTRDMVTMTYPQSIAPSCQGVAYAYGMENQNFTSHRIGVNYFCAVRLFMLVPTSTNN